MMKKIFSLVFFLLTFVISYSQQKDNLEGRITDADNKAIANASISLLNTGKSVLSDEEGNFILKSITTGHYSIEVTAIGYASITQTISIPYQGRLNIKLNKEAQVLDDIVVSAQKKRRRSAKGTVVNQFAQCQAGATVPVMEQQRTDGCYSQSLLSQFGRRP